MNDCGSNPGTVQPTVSGWEDGSILKNAGGAPVVSWMAAAGSP